MTRVVMVGTALAIGVAIVAVAWFARDDDPPQVTTGDTAVVTSPDVPPSSTPAPAPAPGTGSTPSALEGPALEISAVEVDPGDALTVGGGGCGVAEPPTVGPWEVRVWLVPAAGTVPWEPAFADPVATLPPDADGTWQATLTVPRWSTEYRLEAACFDQARPPAGFLYRHERIDATLVEGD